MELALHQLRLITVGMATKRRSPTQRSKRSLPNTKPSEGKTNPWLYPGTFHQSPDSVVSALLPAIPQSQMVPAITLDASQFQPELFNLYCQSQVCLMTFLMWLLKPGVRAVGGEIKTCCKARNRITTSTNLFGRFNFKLPLMSTSL